MEKFKNPEFIQSLIRLCIGTLTYFYISAGIQSGYFNVQYTSLNTFTFCFFLISISNIISIWWKPISTFRRYLALAFDIGCTTLASYYTGGINSVYVLIYLWIYIGYGTRYGLRFLSVAVVLTLIGYNILLLSEDAWHLLTLEAIAFLFLIVALPAYLYALQKKLISSAEQAESKNTAKTELISTMTHQIRTPIGGIVGMIDLLNKTPLSVQQKQYLQSLSQSNHTLQEIIEDLVDFPSIEEGNISLHSNTSNPRRLIDSLVHSLAPLAYEKQLELTCFIDKSFPSAVTIDAQRFRQLLSNLIRYAIEHSNLDGIYITASAAKNTSNSGHDNNLSISIEIKFQQNNNKNPISSTDIPDTNEALPLRIAYQLTRLMNGIFEIEYHAQEICFKLNYSWIEHPLEQDIHFPQHKQVLIFDTDRLNRKVLEQYCEQLGMEVYSTSGGDNLIAHIIWSEEKGKPFDVIILGEDRIHRTCYEYLSKIRAESSRPIPILYATYMHNIEHIEMQQLHDIQATIIKPISLDILTSTLLNLLSNEPEEKLVDAQKQASHNILIAEDNEINASVVYSHLTDMGHNVDIATDGTTALYAIHKHHYQLVFMDINMPNMDGIEATRQWRKLEAKNHHLPIIALTAKATSEDKKACLDAGMDDFLTKPVNENQLIAIIDTYLRK